MPPPPATLLPGGLQGYRSDAGGDVEADAALDADRLQGDLLVRTADQHVRTQADAERGTRGHAAVISGESARADRTWREDEPDDASFLGETDIHAVPVDRPRVALGRTVRPDHQ